MSGICQIEKECTSKSVSEKDLEKIVYQAVMAFIQQVECLDDMVSRFHSEFFHKMQSYKIIFPLSILPVPSPTAQKMLSFLPTAFSSLHGNESLCLSSVFPSDTTPY